MSSPLPRLRSTEGKLRLRGTGGPAGRAAPGAQTPLRVPGASVCPLPDRTSSQARPLSGPDPTARPGLSAAFCFSSLVCFFSKEVKLQSLLAAKAAWAGALGGREEQGQEGQGRARGVRPSLPTGRHWGESQHQARAAPEHCGEGAPISAGPLLLDRKPWWTRPGPDQAPSPGAWESARWATPEGVPGGPERERLEPSQGPFPPPSPGPRPRAGARAGLGPAGLPSADLGRGLLCLRVRPCGAPGASGPTSGQMGSPRGGGPHSHPPCMSPDGGLRSKAPPHPRLCVTKGTQGLREQPRRGTLRGGGCVGSLLSHACIFGDKFLGCL